MPAGVTLVAGQVVVLSLDGTLVYVESMQPTFAGVVALPEQPTARSDDRVFTPGRVGAKKISPFSQASSVLDPATLSERNQKFIAEYAKLREQHGQNYVDRTPEELAAHEAANAPKVPKAKKEKAPKASRQPVCQTCQQQKGHPNHPSDHEFVAPAGPVVMCAACDEPESDPVHTKEKADGGHKFIASKKVKAARQPREPKAPKDPKAPREPKQKKAAVAPDQKFKFIGDDVRLGMLAAMNPKYKAGNSGAAIVDFFKAAPDGLSVQDMAGLIATSKWAGMSIERITVAFTQLIGCTVIG